MCESFSQHNSQEYIIVKILVLHDYCTYLRICILNNTDLAEYIGHVFGDEFVDEQARLPILIKEF